MIVSVYVFGVTEFKVEIVKVDDPGLATVPGLKLGVAPAGRPLTLSETFPLNPFIEVMLMA